jgi:hypothetical protein
MEGKIWAMTGIASNIVEAGRNLCRPAKDEKIPEFRV